MKIGIGSIELGPVKATLLRVAAKINGESLRTRIAKILEGHLARFASVYGREVAYVSRLYGISWEEAFALLSSDRPSPLKDEWTSDDLAWAREQVYLVRQADLGDGSALGIALPASIYAELEGSAIPADVAVAIEEGLRAAIKDRRQGQGFTAYALGRNLGLLSIELLEGNNERSSYSDQEELATGNPTPTTDRCPDSPPGGVGGD